MSGQAAPCPGRGVPCWEVGQLDLLCPPCPGGQGWDLQTLNGRGWPWGVRAGPGWGLRDTARPVQDWALQGTSQADPAQREQDLDLPC